MPIVEAVVEQHAEEVVFLWLLRDAACSQPHYRLRDLEKLDDRVEAHLDGLRIAGEEGRAVCDRVWSLEEAGEVFAASVLSFEDGDPRRISSVLESAAESPAASRGAVSALSWLSAERSDPRIDFLLMSSDPNLRRIGIAASVAHRRDPGQHLKQALASGEPLLTARAARAAGELGRADLLPDLREYIMAEDDGVRFWACWSCSRFGDPAAIAVLKSFAGSDGYSEPAARTAFRRMSAPAARSFRDELWKTPSFRRLALHGAGASGDPHALPWLVDQMSTPEFARVAGEAFSTITGVDVALQDLGGERPEGFEAGPTENPEDESVEMDPDENLPWPDPEKIRTWWQQNRAGFKDGTRYLAGLPISAENLQRVLREGYQRQRAAAALELAFLRPDQPLFEVRAPGFRQRHILGC